MVKTSTLPISCIQIKTPEAGEVWGSPRRKVKRANHTHQANRCYLFYDVFGFLFANRSCPMPEPDACDACNVSGSGYFIFNLTSVYLIKRIIRVNLVKNLFILPEPDARNASGSGILLLSKNQEVEHKSRARGNPCRCVFVNVKKKPGDITSIGNLKRGWKSHYCPITSGAPAFFNRNFRFIYINLTQLPKPLGVGSLDNIFRSSLKLPEAPEFYLFCLLLCWTGNKNRCNHIDKGWSMWLLWYETFTASLSRDTLFTLSVSTLGFSFVESPLLIFIFLCYYHLLMEGDSMFCKTKKSRQPVSAFAGTCQSRAGYIMHHPALPPGMEIPRIIGRAASGWPGNAELKVLKALRIKCQASFICGLMQRKKNHNLSIAHQRCKGVSCCLLVLDLSFKYFPGMAGICGPAFSSVRRFRLSGFNVPEAVYVLALLFFSVVLQMMIDSTVLAFYRWCCYKGSPTLRFTCKPVKRGAVLALLVAPWWYKVACKHGQRHGSEVSVSEVD